MPNSTRITTSQVVHKETYLDEYLDNIDSEIADLASQLGGIVYVDHYSDLVTSGDWTNAINAAFNTGKLVLFNSTFTYTVSGIINTKGQPYIGKMNLLLNRSSITSTTVSLDYSKPSKETFRGIYVQSAYDLCELAKIKSLGFNTLLHYCYFDNNGTIDIGGTIPQLVKNAASVGLNVVVNTQNSVSHNNGTVAQVVAAADSYNNVVGYSVIDEPGSSGKSLAEQEAAISTLRAITSKKLFSVDFIWRLNTWTKPWSYNYDVFLVDSYSMYYASGSLDARVNKDLGKIRTDFGAAIKMTGNAKVIPCFQAYAQPVSNPVEGISGTYCFDLPQIIQASKVFGTVGNGDYACFVWDGGMTTNVRNNTELQNLVKYVSNQSGNGPVKVTEAMIFGGVGSVYQRSLSELHGKLAFKDPNNTVDPWLGGGAFPVRVTTGATETPLRTTTANIDISGIGFNKSFSRLVTTQNCHNYVTAFGVFENYGPALLGSATLNLYSTPDGGYIENLIYSGGVTAGTPFRLSSKVTNNFDGVGEDLVVALSLSNPADYQENYRRIIYGEFILTNW